jgi:glycosyltransferase involved in cell wall biosynthesis
MSPQLRIAVFHLGFFYSGGGEKLVLEEVRGLRALGHQVECFAPYVDTEGCYPDFPEMAQVRALLPRPPRWLPMQGPIWVALCCLLAPLMAWRFRDFDVLLGANQPGPWLAFVVGRMLRKPYIIYLAQPLRLLHPRRVDQENGIRIREGDHAFLVALGKLAGWFIDWADRISVRGADVVLSNGDHVSRWIRRVYGVENQACAAGCHPVREDELDYAERWRGIAELPGVRVPKPFILLTNRHSPMKRFEYAMWALKAVRRQAPRVSLVITGQETEYTDHLRYLASSLGLREAVHFVGLVEEAALSMLYRQAAAYVYPSPEEDFGMGIVEAMAAGTPVVAWANGGPTVTVIDGETGFLIEPYDTQAFSECLRVLVTDPILAERMGRAGHRRAREHFSYERHLALLERTLSLVAFPERATQPVEEAPAPATAWGGK